MYYYLPAKKLTPRELSHLLISLVVLTLAFSFALSDFGFTQNINLLLIYLPISLLAVGTGFFLHEVAHKVVAQQYGCWAEYRCFPQGLLLALFISLFGFVFAAPGAVYIAGSVSRSQNGKISLAGPLTNICIFLVFFPLLHASGFLSEIAYWVCFVNAFLAFFNLLPIPPLDGSKVFRWNLAVYLVALLGSLALLFSVWWL